MRKGIFVLLAILSTVLCFSVVWKIQQRQNQIVTENKMLPEDFAKLLETDIHDQWAKRDRKMKERFKRMWGFSAC